MKFYIPIKLLAVTEGCLVVMFVTMTIILGNHIREDRVEMLVARGRALAHTVLLEIENAAAPNGAPALDDMPDVQALLARLAREKAALGIAHVAILQENGRVLAHTDAALRESQTISRAVIANLGWQQTRMIADDGLYHILVPITQTIAGPIGGRFAGSYVGSVAIAYPRAVIDAALGRLTKTIVNLFLAAVLLSIPLLWGASHLLVTRPMLYLAQVGEQIAQGQPIESIHFTRYRDERAILATVLVNISRYFREVSELATQIAGGSLGDRQVEKRSKRDALGLALQEMLSYLQTVATLATRIGAGDLTMIVPLRSDHDAFGRALQQMVSSLQNMANLATQIASGDLRETFEPRSEHDRLGHAFKEMTTYLSTLAEAATAIAGGDLAQDVHPQSDYDVLGNAFHTMAARLRENFERIRREVEERTRAQQALEQLNQELEARVLERTQELSTAYEEIRMLNDQLKEENLRMGAELDVARRLQTMILPLPEELQHIDGLDIDGYMQPAEEVGGDYYDILQTHGVLHIGIGDVTGHGLESGVLMLMTQTAVRTLIEHGETDPNVFLNTLNRVLFHNIRRMGVDLSLTFAFLNYHRNQVSIIGQHEEVLVVRRDEAGRRGRVERVDTLNLGFPLGLVESIDQWVAECSIDLRSGDGIVLYTDGIPEAPDLDGAQYGVERLCQVVGQAWSSPVDQIRQSVIDDVRRHIGKQKVFDDITLVVLKQQ